MTVVTGLTAARMAEIEGASVVSGHVDGTHLILVTHSGAEIDAGEVIGPVGPGGSGFEICTHTTRPTYSIAEAGKAIYETDTGLIYVWNGYNFRCQEKIICTSTTRPTTLVAYDEGVKIYEQDTGLEYTWTGTSFFLANSYIATFTNAADRDSQWATPPNGAVCRLVSNPGNIWVYESSMWAPIGGLGPGFFGPCLSDTAPLNCVLMYGQTIANAQTLYPACWANTASNWKSGSSLIVPDMRGRVPAGKDNMGGVTAGRLTTTYAGFNGTVLGAAGGDERMHYHRHGLAMFSGYVIGLSGTSGPDGLTLSGNYSGDTQTGWAGSGNSQNVQPTIIFNWALRLL